MAIIIQDEIDVRYPFVFRYDLGAANQWTEFVLPDYGRKISFYFETNDGVLQFNAVDGDPIGTHYASVPADTWFETNLSLTGKNNSGRNSVFLGSTTVDTVVQIIMEG